MQKVSDNMVRVKFYYLIQIIFAKILTYSYGEKRVFVEIKCLSRDLLQAVGSKSGKTSQKVTILDCGEYV